MARFSLKWLFLGVAAVALGTTALVHASDLAFILVNGVFGLSLGMAGIFAVIKKRASPLAIGYVAMSLGLIFGNVQMQSTNYLGQLFLNRSYRDALPDDERSTYEHISDLRGGIACVLIMFTSAVCGGLFAEWVAYKDRKPEGLPK